MATDLSRTIKTNNPPIIGRITVIEDPERGELAKTRSKCPAVILATRRIDSVKGRISTLINSRKTKIGERTKGLLAGTNRIKKLFGDIISSNNRAPIHRGNLILMVKERCLVLVNK